MSENGPTSSAKAPAVFTVPAYRPFLESIARGVLDEVGNDPLKLSDYSIMVPNREAVYLLRQIFMEQLGGKAGIIPDIDAPGNVDNDYLSLQLSNSPLLSQVLMDIPPPVSRLERQLILASEILKIPGMASSLQKAITLGGELGNFIDDLQRNNIELKDVDSLVPEAFRTYWSDTADFLKIITEIWPAKLEEIGKIDPEDHHNALLRIEAEHWRQHPPTKRVLAVGFNDTTPATLDFLHAISTMPQGAIILSGADTVLDDTSWNALTEVHPQYGIKRTLDYLNVTRDSVTEWSASEDDRKKPRMNDVAVTNTERQVLLRETMRPAATAERWSALKSYKKPGQKKSPAARQTEENATIDTRALNGVEMITCGTPQEEASAIALKMRETLETPGRTAMLVTADRSLARRVSARLKMWKVNVEDSAGQSLSDSPVGVYLLSTARMAAQEWAPVPFLEALKHPIAALGEDKEVFSRKIMQIEDKILHGARPGPGVNGAKRALKDAFNRVAMKPDNTLSIEQIEAEKAALEKVIDRLQIAGKDFFEKMASKDKRPFCDLLDDHIRFVEALAADDKVTGVSRVWRGESGVMTARFLTELREASKYMPALTGADYTDVLQTLMRNITLHPQVTGHPALKIVTPEQASLQKADIVILGAMNGEVWPAPIKENPWLSPEMLKKLGLPSPDVGVGRDAHRFVQTASNPEVLISRAVRSGDAPTVSSPFLTRLMMVLRGAGLDAEVEGKSRLLDIHNAIHTPSSVNPVAPPAPKPPVDKRPKELPVTAVEMLMRDPYSVYAKYILKLRPRAPLDAHPSVGEKGTFTHAALDAFVKKYPDKLPADAYDQLLKIGEETFKERMDNPAVQAFWWPRFQRIAKWFVKFENERREMTKTLGTEVRGKLQIDMGGGETFTLTCIADRVDRDAENNIAIIDYKTGSVPTQKAVEGGFSPQLTLEALIASSGGFKNIPAHEVGELEYWKLSGGKPAAEVIAVGGSIEELMTKARAGIEKLIRAYNDPNTPYLPSPRPEWAPRYQSYGHLARTGEWGRAKRNNGKPNQQQKKPAAPGKGKAKP
jgi:ATP-dependent helicase/nuclease subunit B